MKPSERFEPKSDAEMSGDVVVQLLQLFEQHGIEVVVDGGWASMPCWVNKLARTEM